MGQQTVAAGSTDAHDRTELAADLRELLRLIEAVHPEPFLGYDGRVALHARVERLVRSLPETATTEEFYRLAAPVVAGLDDAHSVLRPPEDSPDGDGSADEGSTADGDGSSDDSSTTGDGSGDGDSTADGGSATGGGSATDDDSTAGRPAAGDGSSDDADDRRLPVSFGVVGGELYVESVADDGLSDLVGGRLRAVEGVPVPELVERGRELWAAENRYGALSRAGYLVERPRHLARLLDRERPPDAPTLSVDAGGRARTRRVAPVAGDPDPVAELEPTLPVPTGTGPRYRHCRDGDLTLFVPGNLSEYRESLEAKYAAAPDVAADLAARAYRRQVGGDPPADPEETIAALPSMTETLESMVGEMADAGAETLVVDLRDNPGGDSQFVFLLAYLLAGWDGVARTVEGIGVVRRRSGPYRRRYGDGAGGDGGDTDDGSDADDADSGTDPGDPNGYDFSGYLDAPDGADGTDGADGPDAVDLVRRRLARSPTAADFLDRVDGDGRYRPDRSVVVVSAGTMSSAFAGAAQLRRLGADVVGVPPGQAPVSFGEHVERTLPNTGLAVRLSGSMYRWVADPGGDVLDVDRELTPERFEASGPAGDAALRLALEHAGHDP